MTVPMVVDLPQVLRRLAREEAAERTELGRLEARLRRYEDLERPAYEAWLRLELGPAVTRVEELAVELRTRQMLAERVTELVEDYGVHAREALWLVQEAPAGGGADEPRRRGFATEDPDAVDARRRAKRDRKRAERKQAARERKAARVVDAAVEAGGEAARKRLVGLYRDLARSLHPDSPHVLRALPATRLRAIWAEVQGAYALRSLERLLALATWVETVATTGIDAANGAPAGEAREAGPTLSLAERHERLRAVRRASLALDRRLGRLAAEPAWEFATATPAARRKLKQAAARRLASERAEMEAALAAVDEFLGSIGPPRPPRAERRR